jgi:hypothetical protein
MTNTTHYRILVAIETDATRYHGAHATRPALLSRTAAEQMLAHVAADLANLLPGVSQCSLTSAGALFDQTQILRPDYPVFSALENLAKQSGSDGQPMQISLGADKGLMPVEPLQPDDNISLGILQLLPVLLSGDKELIGELGMEMEHRFIEEGQVSAHTAGWMESAFGIGINHARFMTILDLNAMFRLQLEHFGFLPLWQLLDAALSGQQEPLDVTLESGQVFTWRDGAVHTHFETFDHWSGTGGGKHLESQGGILAGAYSDWTRALRQILTTLKAHDIKLEYHLPGQPERTLAGSFFIEESTRSTGNQCTEVTEHSDPDLGTICVTVVADDQQQNYYPLVPEGLNDIHRAIGERGLGGAIIAFPGSILSDENNRLLMAEPIPDFL